MKRSSLIFCLLLLIPFWGCKPSSDSDKPSTPHQIVVKPESIVLNSGDELNLFIEIKDSDGKVLSDEYTVKSNNEDVAVVNAGRISAIKPGNCKLTISSGALSAEADVFVNPLASKHCNEDREWYRTQMNTGYASNNNCGPTSTHMAIKWYRKGSGSVPEVSEIRDTYPNDGGWWYTSDISNYLKKQNIPFAISSLRTKDDLIGAIDKGNIVILCIDTTWISYSLEDFYHRFYQYQGGHFLVVKGYSLDKEYFIVYDPNNWTDSYYKCGVAMGRNRYFLASELMTSANNWWSYYIEIGAQIRVSRVNKEIPAGRSGLK